MLRNLLLRFLLLCFDYNLLQIENTEMLIRIRLYKNKLLLISKLFGTLRSLKATIKCFSKYFHCSVRKTI
jgi:hypothetical protein